MGDFHISEKRQLWKSWVIIIIMLLLKLFIYLIITRLILFYLFIFTILRVKDRTWNLLKFVVVVQGLHFVARRQYDNNNS